MDEKYTEMVKSTTRKIDEQSKDLEKAYQEELIAACNKWCKPTLWQRIKRWFTKNQFDDLYPFKTIEEKEKAIQEFRNSFKLQKKVDGVLVDQIPIKDLIDGISK